MPAPLAPLLGYCLGVLFAWIARDELGRGQGAAWLASRSAAAVGLFSVCVFGPVSGYFVAFEADWSFAYYVDTRVLPSALQLALAIVDTLSVPLGFAITVPSARSRRIAAVLRLGLPAFVLCVAAVTLALRRLGVQATYAQFHGDFGTRAIAGSALGYALLWLDSLLAFGIVWTVQRMRQNVGSGRGVSQSFERGEVG